MRLEIPENRFGRKRPRERFDPRLAYAAHR
jgi:hypothetical protein